MKRGLLFLLLSIVAIFAVPNALAVPGCYLNTTCGAGFTTHGYVSLQGHFTNVSPTATHNFPYDVCCPNPWPENTGELSFRFSTTNGTGHVSMNESLVTNFAGEAYLGTQYCRIDPAGCDAKEGCIFKVANADNSHVVDCNTPGLPVESSGFDYVCCKVYENCWDGIDNDYDGYLDCADEDCYGGVNGDHPGRPQVCTNPVTGVDSPLVTAYCALSYNTTTSSTNFHPDCIGDDTPPNPINTAYYCSFGLTDDPADDPGVCCEYGKRRYWKPPMGAIPGYWDCRESDECGVSPGLRCNYDFDTSKSDFWAPVVTPNWESEVYDGSANWCNTQVPDLFQPFETLGYSGSNGCCLIPKFGEINYWLDEDNVKVWG